MRKDIPNIGSRLLDWFDVSKRPLPWREHYLPYAVWVSEIMLQQTQVKTALPYFDRWMRELPDIRAVAEASEDRILKLWEGLGYYSRARNLQKAAKIIMETHGGVFPSEYDDILSLPGIGKYTAAAISSIAFNQDRAVVDGNVIRVLSRLFDYSENAKTPDSQKRMEFWAQELLPKGEARNFNQAMMELGALVCTPQKPSCDSCPLASSCVARAEGTVMMRPNLGPKKELEEISVAIAVIWRDGKVFIQKRPSKGLMAGLWEFPGGKLEQGETPRKAVLREVVEETGLTLSNVRLSKKIRHNYTRFKVQMHCFRADLKGGDLKLRSAQKGEWVSPERLKDYPFPAANVQIISDLLAEI